MTLPFNCCCDEGDRTAPTDVGPLLVGVVADTTTVDDAGIPPTPTVPLLLLLLVFVLFCIRFCCSDPILVCVQVLAGTGGTVALSLMGCDVMGCDAGEYCLSFTNTAPHIFLSVPL